jgi:hypothetical protein
MNHYDKSEALSSGIRDDGIVEMQRTLSNALNGGGVNTVATFVDALTHDHRTLQQSTVRFLVEVLVTYGIHCAADDGMLTDGRNEGAVTLCQEIAKLVDGTGTISHI